MTINYYQKLSSFLLS